MDPNSKGLYGSTEETEAKNAEHRKQMALNLVQRQLENFQESVTKDVQDKINTMIDEINQEIRHYEFRTNEFKEFARDQYNQLWCNRTLNSDVKHEDSINETDSTKKHLAENLKTTKSKRDKLPEKVFMARDSYLTALLEVSHMRSIYHFFYVLLIFLFLNNAVHDYITLKRINIGLESIHTGFANFNYALGVWCLLLSAVIGLYYAFKMWVNTRKLLKTNEPLQTMWDYGCTVLFVSFLFVFGFVCCISCSKFKLPLASSAFVLMDGCRLIMKMHAFIRTNAPKQLQGKLKTDEVNLAPELPKIANYLYFIFAPTLIYRDSYPRTRKIRWLYAFQRFSEIIATIFLFSCLHERYLRPNFIDFGKNTVTAGSITVSLFNAMMPGLIIFLGGFYCILHASQNFGAELTRFADRMFYRDWWTCGDFDKYYRYWNTVVHDYLYEYIYKDLYLYVFKGSKVLSSLMVFFISALIHEVILSFGLKFVYPVLFVIFFGVGTLLTLISRIVPYTIGNSMILAGACMGNGVMIGFYYMEYYARKNCPVGTNWIDLFTPVSLTCSNGIRT